MDTRIPHTVKDEQQTKAFCPSCREVVVVTVEGEYLSPDPRYQMAHIVCGTRWMFFRKTGKTKIIARAQEKHGDEIQDVRDLAAELREDKGE